MHAEYTLEGDTPRRPAGGTPLGGTILLPRQAGWGTLWAHLNMGTDRRLFDPRPREAVLRRIVRRLRLYRLRLRLRLRLYRLRLRLRLGFGVRVWG